jgi:hypothetical protein
MDPLQTTTAPLEVRLSPRSSAAEVRAKVGAITTGCHEVRRWASENSPLDMAQDTAQRVGLTASREVWAAESAIGEQAPEGSPLHTATEHQLMAIGAAGNPEAAVLVVRAALDKLAKDAPIPDRDPLHFLTPEWATAAVKAATRAARPVRPAPVPRAVILQGELEDAKHRAEVAQAAEAAARALVADLLAELRATEARLAAYETNTPAAL